MALFTAEARIANDLTCHPRYIAGNGRLKRDFQLDTSRVLGSGMDGDVHLATACGADGAKRAFAVKSLTKEMRISRDPLEEVLIHLAMDHPHIVSLERVFEEDTTFHLVMECMEGGELFDRLEQQGRYDEAEATAVIRQALLAVSYLHAQGIVHRDLKLENFLYESSDSGRLKLIDFGLATRWSSGSNKMRKCCGTLTYVAPEVLRKTGYTEAVDLWSLGVVAYILLVGCSPWSSSEAKMTRMILNGRPKLREDRFLQLSTEAQDFVRGLLTFEPSARLTAASALQHPWLQAGIQTLPALWFSISSNSCGKGELADEVETLAGSDSDEGSDDSEQLLSRHWDLTTSERGGHVLTGRFFEQFNFLRRHRFCFTTQHAQAGWSVRWRALICHLTDCSVAHPVEVLAIGFIVLYSARVYCGAGYAG